MLPASITTASAPADLSTSTFPSLREGRDDLEPRLLGHREGRKSDRRGATPDEQRLAGLDLEAGVERAVARLQHLGSAPSTSQASSVSSGKTLDDGTLAYSAYEPSNARPMPPIIAATRSTPGGERTARVADDGAHALDAEHARQLHGR
ncbi:MAG: hypothetical protein H6730_05230 [Deltaproteobacteria bacterium]|nr:hypothetical protein [Deltaproteobacteria bacterium]